MTQTFGILAHPTSHSLSPVIHNAGFKALNIDAEYLSFDIPPEKLDDFFQRVKREKIGLSVSIPHKESVLKYCDELSDAAKAIGAVNTLYWKEGKLIGDNTDYLGILYPLVKSIKSVKSKSQKANTLSVIPAEAGIHYKGTTMSQLDLWRDDINNLLQNKNILILGAGGAARAAVYACLLAGANVKVLNRTKEKAEKLVEDFENFIASDELGVCADSVILDSRLRGNDRVNGRNDKHSKLTYGSLNDYSKEETDIIIQTTSVGMMSDKSLLNEGDFCEGQIAFDIVYRPRITQFLKNAQKAGANIITGDEMFLEQAFSQFYLFTGKEAPQEVMKQSLFACI
jgi:shikimate dehydrogenase